jgi:dihydrofolate reductase
MRKIIVSNLVSLDGFISGPNGEIDWFISIVDKEFEEYSVNLINSIDTMLFGRITYQLMESYWSVATTAADDQKSY